MHKIKKMLCLLLCLCTLWGAGLPYGQAAECSHQLYYECFDTSCHTVKCRNCSYEEKEPHLFSADSMTGALINCVCGQSPYYYSILLFSNPEKGTIYFSRSSSSGIGLGGPASEMLYADFYNLLFAENETVTFRAEPGAGYYFTGWHSIFNRVITGDPESEKLITRSKVMTKSISWLKTNCEIESGKSRVIIYLSAEFEEYTMKDVSKLFRWWNGKLELTETELNCLDANGDSVTNLQDAAMIFRLLSKKEAA